MIGIGRPVSRSPDAVSNYVLSNLTRDEIQFFQNNGFADAFARLKVELKM